MDVIGSFGYVGQQIQFIDAERFAYQTGNAICIYDTSKGPREMVWRMEHGVSCFATDFETGCMIYAPSTSTEQIEIVNAADQTNRNSLSNPIPVPVVYMCISREGDKVFGISNTTDHSLLVWSSGHTTSGGSEKPRLLLAKKLEQNYRRCSVNPTNANYVCLEGDYGISVGILNEVMGNFSVKFSPIELLLPEPDVDSPETNIAENSISREKMSETEIAANKTINFSIWLPQNRLLVGTRAGTIYVVNCDTKSSRYLGRFSVPDKRGAGYKTGIITPTHAILSVHHLVIGTEHGFIYWFPTLNLMSADENEPVIDLSNPAQVSYVGSAVSCLTVDQHFLTLLAGTFSGEILKMVLDVPEREEKQDLDQDPLSSSFGAELLTKTQFLDSVSSEALGSDARDGVILCAQHLTIDVQKFTARARSSLSVFVTGTHSGALKFWRYNSAVVDNMVIGGGIRRSVPRALKSIFQMTLTPSRLSEQESFPPAVCVMRIAELPMRHAKLIVVGTETGSVEVWTLDAQENEDEDAKESAEDKGDSSLRLIEDDEGSCLVRLEARKIYQTRVFVNPTSDMLTYPVSYETKGKHAYAHKLAMCSDSDNRIFIMNLLKDDHLAVHSGIDAAISVDEGESPCSLYWYDDLLYVSCDTGSVYLFQTKEFDTPQLMNKLTVGVSDVLVNSLSLSLMRTMVLDSTPQVTMFPIKCLYHDTPITFENGLKTLDHVDIVVFIAHSPNGRYFATGCVDGSIYIWKVDLEADDCFVANTLKPHAGPVSSLSFSTDSSMLLSCGVDGSCFIFTLDKPNNRGGHGAHNSSMRSSFMQQEEGPQYLSDIMPSGKPAALPPPSTITWADQREKEKAKEMKSRHKFKAMGISAAISEIGQRLQVLVQQNSERNELEKLDRSDFVIDVARKDSVAAENLRKVEQTRRLYEQRNYCNELRAARVRAKCWDPSEVKSVTLLPLTPEAERDPSMVKDLSVSSYSILKYTPVQQSALDKVKRMRIMEVRLQGADSAGAVQRITGTNYYRCAWKTAVTGCPLTVSWISNDGKRWPISEKVADLLAEEKVVQDATEAGATGAAAGGADATAAGGGTAAAAAAASGNAEGAGDVEDDASVGSVDEDHEMDEQNVLNLLYPPQAVRTPVQKRNQIILLKEAIRQIRLKFNEEFDKLRREKEDIISSIDSRNARMQVILEDLHENEELFAPKLANREIMGSTVKLESEELTTQPYESQAAREKRLKEEEERIQRELEKDKEDVKGRALEEMMHGSLEVKRDVLAEGEAFTRPEWMETLTPNEMNESQLKEYEAFQAKLKALQEEQAAYRKSLEQEMKKLKNEVTELCKAFDEKLAELSTLKVSVHREVFSHEIYISRLALNMAKTEQTLKFLRKSEEQVQQLRAERAELRSSIEQLGTQLEEMKVNISNIQEEERQMDKTFRRDLQNMCNTTFDQDYLKVLTGLYRRRTYPRGGFDPATGGQTYDTDQSEQDQSASRSKTQHRRSKDTSNSNRGAKSHRGSSSSASHFKRGSALNTSDANKASKIKMRASKGGGGGGGGGANQSKDGGGGALGPMQAAAQALRSSNEEPSYKDKNPYYEALMLLEKQKLYQESQIPILNQLSIELDCPEGFDIDQFSWSKLTELRNKRIEKEIEGKVLSIEFSRLKQKLELLDAEEGILATCISEIKASRDAALASLKDLSSNLELVVRLRQGQDEVDEDAVVTDYSDALLLPSNVITKYNTRIKELGKEKIAVLLKIKLFRRKINLIDWEAKHHGLEAQHLEAYLTDLQLFRVTRELQKVVRDGADAALAKERLDKVNQRIEYQAQDAENKLAGQRKNKELVARQLDERKQECAALEDRIAALKSQVALSKSVKHSRDEARGDSGDAIGVAAAKMKKVVKRRQQVDLARAQAEEIDYLRQELDKMRQRTFPSFVRATKKRITSSVTADHL